MRTAAGAWNYPVQLSLMPVIGAIAAGCPACLKVPSDKYSTACSPVLGKLVAKYLDQSCIRVVEGDRHATQAVRFIHCTSMKYSYALY
jgi:aldehyde dehydrogenase (NAD+)